MTDTQRENLWAPWRMEYIRRITEADRAASSSAPSCFLCEAAACPVDSPEAKDRLVLLHDQRGLIVLNRYPYTNGHVLVACGDHIGDLTDLSTQQRGGLMELVAVAEATLRIAFNPQGFNVGLNLGRCAGAGLPGHLHAHVVPRWSGDTNFMQTIGEVRVIPDALEHSFEHLSVALGKVEKK